MNQINQDTKTSVNITLDTDLLRQASALTSDLSETVERLLMAYIAEKRTKPEDNQRALDVTTAWLNDIHETYGLAGADFSPL